MYTLIGSAKLNGVKAGVKVDHCGGAKLDQQD